MNKTMKNIAYCAFRSFATAALVGVLFSYPSFIIDAANAINAAQQYLQKEKPISREEKTRCQQILINYHQGSIVGAPFKTPYTNWFLPISAGIGGFGGLVIRINNIKNKKHPLEGLDVDLL